MQVSYPGEPLALCGPEENLTHGNGGELVLVRLHIVRNDGAELRKHLDGVGNISP